MVPKQTLSSHLISRFVGCAWQSGYICSTIEDEDSLGEAGLRAGRTPPMYMLSLNEISFLWFFLGSSHSLSTVMMCGILETARGNVCRCIHLFLGAFSGEPLCFHLLLFFPVSGIKEEHFEELPRWLSRTIVIPAYDLLESDTERLRTELTHAK